MRAKIENGVLKLEISLNLASDVSSKSGKSVILFKHAGAVKIAKDDAGRTIAMSAPLVYRY